MAQFISIGDHTFTAPASMSRTCVHCNTPGTTRCGALWRVSLADECQDLYYLHTGCLRDFKAAQGLRSVEGRQPLAGARARRGPKEVVLPR